MNWRMEACTEKLDTISNSKQIKDDRPFIEINVYGKSISAPVNTEALTACSSTGIVDHFKRYFVKPTKSLLVQLADKRKIEANYIHKYQATLCKQKIDRMSHLIFQI